MSLTQQSTLSRQRGLATPVSVDLQIAQLTVAASRMLVWSRQLRFFEFALPFLAVRLDCSVASCSSFVIIPGVTSHRLFPSQSLTDTNQSSVTHIGLSLVKLGGLTSIGRVKNLQRTR